MTVVIDASELSLNDVKRKLKYEEQYVNSFTPLLLLEEISELERQEVIEISNIYREYYAEGKISEGQIKFLVLAPLLKLAGFYQPGIRITLEEKIAEISVEDEDVLIKGRMDILANQRIQDKKITTSLWVLVVESKNSTIDAMQGLPQLLTYAYNSLENQPFVWGLTTNGMRYQFIYIRQGNPPFYQILPDLNLLRAESAGELLQVLKAIGKL